MSSTTAHTTDHDSQAAHPRDEAATEHSQNDQTHRAKDGNDGPDPKQPNERDESADTAAEPQPRIQQAHDDLKRGLRDTDRGAPMDEAYRKQK